MVLAVRTKTFFQDYAVLITGPRIFCDDVKALRSYFLVKCSHESHCRTVGELILEAFMFRLELYCYLLVSFGVWHSFNNTWKHFMSLVKTHLTQFFDLLQPPLILTALSTISSSTTPGWSWRLGSKSSWVLGVDSWRWPRLEKQCWLNRVSHLCLWNSTSW